MRICSSWSGGVVRPLDPGLDPGPLVGLLDVHVLDADRAAVRVAQHAEDLPQLHQRPAAEAAGRELALQIPQGEAVLVDVQVGVLALLVLQRVGVRHQVTAHPVGVDQLVHPGRPADVVLVPGRQVAHPADRLVGDAQRAEDLVVEAVAAEQQVVDRPQELAGLRPLDDPVVVGRGERHRLADRQPVHRLLGRALELRRVIHRADADDASLAGHEPGYRVDGPDGTRVGQADGHAGEVVDLELAGPRLADQILVRDPELPEVHGLGGLDARHQQLAGPVVLADVDGQAEVDVGRLDQHRLAVHLGEGVIHLGHHAERLDHREADQVGKRDLAAAAAAQVVVDHDAVVDEQLGGHGAHARRRGHAQARRHVDGRPRGGAAEPDLLGVRGGPRPGGLGRRRRSRRGQARPAPPARREPRARPGRPARAPWPAPWPAPWSGGSRPPRSGGSRRRNSTRPGPPRPGRRGTAGTARRREARSGRSPRRPRSARARPRRPRPRHRAARLCRWRAHRLLTGEDSRAPAATQETLRRSPTSARITSSDLLQATRRARPRCSVRPPCRPPVRARTRPRTG